MVQSHVNELTTAATMLPAIRRTLEEFAVEINRVSSLLAPSEVAEEAADEVVVGVEKAADEVVVGVEEAEESAELELGL